jgi:hypothetical protein
MSATGLASADAAFSHCEWFEAMTNGDGPLYHRGTQLAFYVTRGADAEQLLPK